MQEKQKTPQLGKEIKTLAGHSMTYGIAEILSRVIGFLMIPVYTRYLSPTDYGIQEIVGLTVEVIGIVLNMGIADAIYRYYYETKESHQQRLVISTALAGIPVLSFTVLSSVAFFAKPLAALVLDGTHQYPYILLALGTLWGNQIVNLTNTYLRVIQQSKAYLVLSVVKLLIALSLNILFVVFLGKGVMGIFISNIIVAVGFGCGCYLFTSHRVGLRFSADMAKKMLRFSLPIVPANLASLVVSASDRYFVKAFFSLADAGIYSLGYKLGNVVFYLVRVPFMQIWSPRRFQLYRDGAPPLMFAKVATYFVGLMTLVALTISISVHDIIKLITPSPFWGAASYAPAVSLCYVLYALDNHVGFGILINKKTEYWTYVNFGAAGSNLLFNFLLIPPFGAWGAVGATFASLVFKITGLHLVSRKLYFIPFEWGRMGGITLIAILIYAGSRLVHPEQIVLAFCWDIFLTGCFPAVLWMLGIIDAEEKRQISSVIKKQFSGSTKHANGAAQ